MSFTDLINGVFDQPCRISELGYICYQNLNLTVNHFTKDNRIWDIQTLSLIIPPFVVQTIKGILLPGNDLLDELYWSFTSNGKFTVKSAIWLAHNFCSPSKWEFSRIRN